MIRMQFGRQNDMVKIQVNFPKLFLLENGPIFMGFLLLISGSVLLYTVYYGSSIQLKQLKSSQVGSFRK